MYSALIAALTAINLQPYYKAVLCQLYRHTFVPYIFCSANDAELWDDSEQIQTLTNLCEHYLNVFGMFVLHSREICIRSQKNWDFAKTETVEHFFLHPFKAQCCQTDTYQSIQRHTRLAHPFQFLTFGLSGAQDWAPERPNVQKL